MVLRLLIILFSFTILSSCGDSDESQQENLILSANIAMGSGDCDEAISLMTSITTPTDNADFIKTLALSYACKAKFNATTFITTDLSKFGSDGTFNGTTLFTTSDDMTSITDDDWVYLLRAMNTILYAGGLSTEEDPTSSLRLQKFSQDDLNELEMVLVYLQLVSIGRFFHYHGEANSVGEKKDCLIQYENVGLNGGTNLQLLLQADTDSLTGSCTDANFTTAGVGSSDFGTPGDYNIARLCEGAMLMNNFLHVFPSLLARISGSDFDDIQSMEATMNTLKAALNLLLDDVGTQVSNVLSQTKCEQLNASSADKLQVYYMIMLERLFK